jgi:hypothetical protein
MEIFGVIIIIYTNKNYMKKTKNKIAVSITLSPIIIKLLDDKTSNRSNYIDNVIMEYFNTLNIDTTKIKL